VVTTYAFEIAPDVWNSILGELKDLTSLLAGGNDFVVRHPVTLHGGNETVTGATLKLHGQSSWAETVMLDGPRAKIQFDISFHQTDPNGKFHGVEKLVFDMPRTDWAFMHDRLAHAWFRQAGIAAGCAANARVEINGAYNGLYVAEENTNKRVLGQFFPDNTGGLWKAGQQPETSATLQAVNVSRQTTFAKAKDVAAISAIVDLKSSVLEWAGEALINDADGFYGGDHNFYIYESSSGWGTKCDSVGCIAVFPNSATNGGNGWNVGYCCQGAQTNKVDDVQFTRDMIKWLAANTCVDPKRIYCKAFPFPSAQVNVDTWAHFDMCTGAATTLSTNSICKTYMSCADSTEVTLCTAPSGSHCGSYGLSKIVDTAWGMFQNQALPQP
jgi:hypothetical protein